MNYKTYYDTYFLVKGLNEYRESQKQELIEQNQEYCKSFYNGTEKEKDGRKSFCMDIKKLK